MQIKLMAFISICLVGTAALFVLSTRNTTKFISPIVNQSNVLSDVTTITPTFTPTPTATPSSTPTPIQSGPTPTRKPTPRPTRKPTPTPVIVTSADLEALFSKYSSEYSVDKELLKRIANCESGFNTNASSLGYAGLFQFSEGIWTSTRTLIGQNTDADLRLNAEEAIRTAAFMVSQNHLYIWPNCNK